MSQGQRAPSPVQTRIKSLSDKLNGMQSGLQDVGRREQLEARAAELAGRLVKAEQKEQQQFLLLKGKLKDFQAALKGEQDERLMLEEQLGRQIAALEQRLKVEIGLSIKGRLDEEASFNERLSEHVRLTAETIARQNTIREEQNALQMQQLSVQLAELARKVEECVEGRTKEIRKLEEVFGVELEQLTIQVQREERERQEMEAALYGALEDACRRLQDRIAKEREAREATHEQMLNLLDDVCGRVEQCL